MAAPFASSGGFQTGAPNVQAPTYNNRCQCDRRGVTAPKIVTAKPPPCGAELEELTRTAQLVNNATFRPLFVFSVVAGLYFLLCLPLSWLSLRLELRLKRNLGRAAAH